jgi:calcium channel MID1
MNCLVPFHEKTAALPQLGDTTSNQAILFSRPFSTPPLLQPSYPNYTLPPANLSLPAPPDFVPNFTLILDPTLSSSLTTIPQTGCRLNNIASAGTTLNQSLWLRDGEGEGWRMQWLLEGLTPSTNYTAYVVESSTKVSGPIFFVTKSGRL